MNKLNRPVQGLVKYPCDLLFFLAHPFRFSMTLNFSGGSIRVLETDELISSRLYRAGLCHQHDSLLWRSWAMQNALGDCYTLIGV